MKLVQTNEGLFDPEGTLWVPDTIAAWDAVHHWERERLGSMKDHLRPGMRLVDVGAEHGWWSAIVAQWVGPENVVLCEPSPEMWSDIRLTWEANQFPMPSAIWPGFVGAEMDGEVHLTRQWPSWCLDSDESPVVPYRYLHDEGHRSQGIPTITIDAIGLSRKIDAITLDVEGAEMLVMQGAQRVLAEHRPLVWASVHPDLMERDYHVTPDDLSDLMRSCGYRQRLLAVDHEHHVMFSPKEYRG